MSKKSIDFGYIQDEKIYLTGIDGNPDREIGVVKDGNETESVQYFINRFSVLEEKVSALEKAISEAENKGSFLMKLIHMKDSLYTYDGLGDYSVLKTRLEAQEVEIQGIVDQNRKRNTEIKKGLAKELEEILKGTDWNDTTEAIKDVKMRWLKTGKPEEEFEEPYETEFEAKVTDFFERKRIFYEDKKKLIDQRIRKYEKLLREVKGLARNSPDLDRAEQRAEEIKKEWRGIGKIPPTVFGSLIRKFNNEVKSFEKLVSIARRNANSPEDLARNLVKKEALLMAVERIEFEATEDALEESRKLMGMWKKIGRLPRDKSKEITERFMVVCDKINERLRLNKKASSMDEDFESKNNREQIVIKMRLLREKLNQDEMDLRDFYDNMGNMQQSIGPGGRPQLERSAMNKMVTLKKNVKVKKELMRELKNSLN